MGVTAEAVGAVGVTGITTCPVPERLTVWVADVVLLSVTVKIPVAAPAAVGVKVTLIVHVVLVAGATGAANVVPQEPPAVPVGLAKGAAVLMPLMVRAPLPVLDKVTV